MRATILMAVLMLVPCVRGEVAVGDSAPQFSLDNANDSTFSMTHPRAEPLVLLFTTKDLGDYSLAWHDSIHTHAPDAQIQSVLDLSDVSSWVHGVARIRIKAKGSKAIIDWDGEISEQWRGEDRSHVVVFLIAPDNRVELVLRGNATRENVVSVVRTLAETGTAE